MPSEEVGFKMEYYQELACRTKSEFVAMTIKKEGDITRNIDMDFIDLMHAGVGLGTEAGEFLDAIKRVIFYGKPFTAEVALNLVEELGDTLWYVAIACQALGVDMGKVMEANIAKLKQRHGDKFNDVKVLDRNLDAEKAAMDRILNAVE